jgi:hypothetical protein
MTERHPPLRNPRLERAAEWHPIEGSPEKVGAEGAVEATAIETYGFITSVGPEGN